MADPTDVAAFDEIGRLLKRELELVAVAESQLLPLLDRSYTAGDRSPAWPRSSPPTHQRRGRVRRPARAVQRRRRGRAGGALLHSVFEEALRVRASDIHIEPQERSLRIRFRIDGVLHVQTEADAKIAGAVALRLKLMSGLDISEKRLPQDGRFNVKLQERSQVDVRISTMPTQHGESVVMRLLNQNTGLLRLDGLGLPPSGSWSALRAPSCGPAAWCW
jgi:MSHA biogenesis protein MshE